MATTYDEDRKVITMKNFFSECFKFIKRSFSPFVVPIDYALLYMLQSKQYVLTPDFISCYRKICFNEANTLWQMLHEPENSTIEQVRAIVFDPRTYDNYRVSFLNLFCELFFLIDNCQTDLYMFQYRQSNAILFPAWQISQWTTMMMVMRIQ